MLEADRLKCVVAGTLVGYHIVMQNKWSLKYHISFSLQKLRERDYYILM